jgi:hypothetical protein
MKTRRSNRRNARNARNARSRSSKKGGWGGWPRTTFVGPAWNGTNGSNYFELSKSGVPAGNPIAVPEFWGPNMQDANRLVPTLKINALSKGGGGSKTRHRSSSRSKRGGYPHLLSMDGGGSKTRHRSSSRSKRGGFVFGGFPQDMKIGWDNLKIGAQNMYRGFMGNNQLTSASPWNQPALNAKMGPSMPKITDTNKLIANATKTVNEII